MKRENARVKTYNYDNDHVEAESANIVPFFLVRIVNNLCNEKWNCQITNTASKEVKNA